MTSLEIQAIDDKNEIARQNVMYVVQRYTNVYHDDNSHVWKFDFRGLTIEGSVKLKSVDGMGSRDHKKRTRTLDLIHKRVAEQLTTTIAASQLLAERNNIQFYFE